MTPFAKKVYKIVSVIPIGEVRTYKWVARKAGKPKASRAVGQILKRNHYPLIIPCHRVINSNNKIGGYVFGVNKKKLLLDMEKEILRCLGTRK
ncbi:MAG: MGMT family protein [Candidatus Omnitrophica bacterium]|nr:MGMT family protein [Candidatus Omnitrophota bacterium]